MSFCRDASSALYLCLLLEYKLEEAEEANGLTPSMYAAIIAHHAITVYNNSQPSQRDAVALLHSAELLPTRDSIACHPRSESILKP